MRKRRKFVGLLHLLFYSNKIKKIPRRVGEGPTAVSIIFINTLLWVVEVVFTQSGSFKQQLLPWFRENNTPIARKSSQAIFLFLINKMNSHDNQSAPIYF